MANRTWFWSRPRRFTHELQIRSSNGIWSNPVGYRSREEAYTAARARQENGYQTHVNAVF